ncbi:activity-dependent neuroprotector homeobox protein 2b isoform X2 [Austrofundulus limnaeus]|uniref:Activity-dependent neuroprotector homeobox protein 2b isoform X2 n=1 Tax=Austrofundulus limnaeus TaxID=52670 RepID=A0A2I4B0H9_AUSLI|nr:PREDICTED: ADNP homeobox protein 2 isoform X2 [Austrofundulus limnaeus]
MYQFPVVNVDKIRRARKAVKNILSEIGLEDCQNLLKDLNENSPNSDEEEAFQETDWIDVTDGYSSRKRKKWPYRSQSVCCSMCKYSSKNIYNFRVHVSRCHMYGQSVCALVPCTQCLFIAHPKIVKKHMLFFHGKVPVSVQQQVQKASPVRIHHGNQRYQCARCGYPCSFIFAMKKHIILKHLEHLAEQYIGYRLHQQANSSVRIYCCKECKVNTGTLDQMLHHMLVEPAHYSISTQVQSMISENKNYIANPTPNGNGLFVSFPSIAPKPQAPQILTKSSLVLPSNGQPSGAVVAVQPLVQPQGTTNSTTLLCTPGTNQTFLPPQASALVQLASAEAKGLLQPGATIALRSALPQGSSVVPLPTGSNVSLKQAPVTLSAATTQPQQTQQSQQILLPSGLQTQVESGSVPKPIKHTTLQGTMLTSQSLLNHLIPTGNKVNGMPTYTFAPLQAAMPVSQRLNTPLQPVDQGNSAPQTKKWITCPLCNELFPSNVFDMHMEVAHPTKPSFKTESVAARAAALKKMPDKTVKCLMCKILLSEKTLFQHLLHGLNCLYCAALFFSVKQLIEHVQQHNPSSKAYCDLLRQKYRVYSKGTGEIVFPYIDVTTTAPREVIGDKEVNLALVTNTLELIYFKLQPTNQQGICSAPVKISSSYCPFCSEKFQNLPDHLQHLKQKHFVAPTIHAILQTEAFKCIYCNGVYTGKVTQQAVKLHIQRCRCSPKPPKPQPPPPPKPTPVMQVQTPPKPAQQLSQASGLYFLQMPQGMTMTQTLAPARLIAAPPPAQPKESEAEIQSKKRLEAALKEAMEANRREREEKAARRKKREQEKLLQEKLLQEKQQQQEKQLQLEAAAKSDPNVKLMLEPTPAERRSSDERRDFLSKYFNKNPYASKAETEELARRLSANKGDVAGHFSKKRSKCMKSLKKNRAAILLGFNMTELCKVKHNLLIPEPQLPPSQEDDEEETPPAPTTDSAEPTGTTEDEPEPMDRPPVESIFLCSHLPA